MGITGQVSLARVGRNVQIFEQTEDLIDVFNPNVSPTLEAEDHVTLYPGDFRPVLQGSSIEIPNDVYLTILPGALVGYDSVTGPPEDRYRYITGAIENVADLNLADQYVTESERQLSRIRIYPDETNPTTAFTEVDDLDEAAEIVEPGETVVVFPGVYEPTRNLYVDETTWRFLDGAVVRYTPQFQGTSSGTYPHALFDDLKDFEGETDSGGKDIEVYGDGEFQIGTSSAQPSNASGDYGTGSELFDPATKSPNDWKGWHLYSVLAVNNEASDAVFEAKKVEMGLVTSGTAGGFADAAFKLGAASSVEVDVEEGRIGSNVQQDPALPTALTPSFIAVNGKPLTSSVDPELDFNFDRFVIEAGTAPNVRFAIAVNTNPDPQSNNNLPGQRNPFAGEIDLRVQDAQAEDDQTGSQFMRFTNEASPKKLIINETNTEDNNAPVLFSGRTPDLDSPVTKLVVKNSELATSGGSAPLRVEGDQNGFDLKLSDAWLLTGETVDFDLTNITTFCLANGTGSTDWTVEVYGDSFGDAPIQDYRDILHPELNNFVWSADVESLS